MAIFDIFDSLGRDLSTAVEDVSRQIDTAIRGDARALGDFATLDQSTQRSIVEDIRTLTKQGLDENAIRDLIRRKYNIDLHPDFIRTVKADFETAGRDIKGFLKKLGIGAGIAGAGLGLGFLLGRRTSSPPSPSLSSPSPLPPYSTSALPSPASPFPTSPYPTSPSSSSPTPGNGGGFLGLPSWVWLIIALIIIAVFGYLLYKHHKKRGAGAK